MKKILVAVFGISIWIIIASCKSVDRIYSEPPLYSVYKIDSLNNYYVVYARLDSSNFKIISPKIDQSECQLIEVGKNYKFDLSSYNSVAPVIPVNNSEIHLALNDSTSFGIEPENDIYDLYFANNVKGLCIVICK